jgi:uncharacterized protein
VNEVAVLDTGPLVALVRRQDRYHAWAREQVDRFDPPLLSCETVVAEALFLLRARQGGSAAVMGLVDRGVLRLPFRLEEECGAVSELLQRYANVPMSLADACLVRMTEQHDGAMVLTLDSDFDIYRRHRRQVIPTIRPHA